jgi:hypothetical protein
MAAEKPIDTAIRYLEWYYIHRYKEGEMDQMPMADFYNIRRFVEQLKEFRGNNDD